MRKGDEREKGWEGEEGKGRRERGAGRGRDGGDGVKAAQNGAWGHSRDGDMGWKWGSRDGNRRGIEDGKWGTGVAAGWG